MMRYLFLSMALFALVACGESAGEDTAPVVSQIDYEALMLSVPSGGWVKVPAAHLWCSSYDEMFNAGQPGRWTTADNSSGPCDVRVHLSQCHWASGDCLCLAQVLEVDGSGCAGADLNDIIFP